MSNLIFNPPPGWPKPPQGWTPPSGWTPDPSWPDPPSGWQLWIGDETPTPTESESVSIPPVPSENPAEASGTSQLELSVNDKLAALEAENARLREQLVAEANSDTIQLDDAQVLQDVGIYRYHHPLETAANYQERLKAIEADAAELVRSRRAIAKSELFTFNNSLAQGKKLSNDLGRLMLRAYNSEVDNAARSLKAGNVITAKKRVEASRNSIAKLGMLMEMHITDEFHTIRLDEIELTADWLMKKQEEREAAREERARLREERRVQKELEEERARLDKEHAHLVNALQTLQSQGKSDEELERRLGLIDQAIEQNDFRAANIRAGYIYVISNEGAFGPGVVKIGLTRRLEPSERISELSGAAVPFRFDTHTLFFSEDAVTLENELHHHFASRALNQTNARKEFFFATPEEVREVLLERIGNILEFSADAEAIEYRQSLHAWPQEAASRRI